MKIDINPSKRSGLLDQNIIDLAIFHSKNGFPNSFKCKVGHLDVNFLEEKNDHNYDDNKKKGKIFLATFTGKVFQYFLATKFYEATKFKDLKCLQTFHYYIIGDQKQNMALLAFVP